MMSNPKRHGRRRRLRRRAGGLLAAVCMLPLERRMLLASAFIDPPAPPQVFLDTTYVPGTGQTRNVAAGGDLQGTINAAQLGDTIVLAAGATFSGNFTLPNKTTGSGWITIRSGAADTDLPAPGTRITPAHASLMPKIVSSNANAAIATANNAHHYRFIGVEFTIAASVTSNTGIVVLGSGTQTTAQTPNNLTFDRCYIHGNPTANVQNGMRLNSASTAVIDSYFDQCQADATAFESHCIGGYNGPGPYKLVNNTFSSATIPVIFGGALTTNSNIPSDMEIRNNYFTRPRSWYSGDPSFVANNWYVKNLFELKNAQRVLFDGNLLENNWPHTGATADGSPQQGFAILLTTRGQKDGGGVELMPQNVVQDIAITNNVIRKSTVGMSLYGGESSGAKRIKVANNLFDEINSTWGNNDRTGMFAQFQTVGDTSFDHNTIINNGDIIFANGTEVADIDFTNNISNHNAARTINPNQGINGAGTGIGDPTLTGKFVQYTVTKNVMVNGSNHSFRYTGTTFGATAAGNFFPTTTTTPGDFSAVGFTSLTNRDYRLAASSIYNNAATDGTDVGANIDTLETAVSGAVSLPISGSTGNDTYYVKRNGSLLEIYNNATGTGTPILRDQFVYYESLNFNTGGGDDRVIVDRTGGDPVPTGGVFVDGAAASASDIVQIIGNGAAATYKPSGSVAGRGVITLAGLATTRTITVLGTEELELSNLVGLTVSTPNAADTLTVSTPAAGKNRVSGSSGAMSFGVATLTSTIPLTIDAATNDVAGGSIDAVTINAAAGSSVRFISGAGNDSMTISGGALTFNANLGADSSSLALSVASAGAVTFNATQHLRSLTVDGVATMSANGARALLTKSLTINGAGQVDLTNNDLLLDYTGPTALGTWDGSKYTGVTGMLQSAFNFNAWDGPGLRSSAASASQGLTTLGISEARDVLFLGDGQTALWNGVTVDATTVIVKYTYAGDVNLDGLVDASDYGVIDNYFQFPGTTGYANGDFNFDGVIDAADYGYIDNSFQLQGPPL
jgi:hypothetical protein